MKKLTTLVLAAGLVVSSFAGASAGELRTGAQFSNHFVFGSVGQNANDGTNTIGAGNAAGAENFFARNRIQLGFDYVASETLSGTFLMRVQQWYGSGEFDSSWNEVLIRLAYVDWMVPNTDVKVRLGYQGFALPAFAFGAAVLDGRGSGVTVSAPINENINLTAGWLRIASGNDNISGPNGDDFDTFMAIADFNYDGFRVAPWVAYSMIGKNVFKSGTQSVGDFNVSGFHGIGTALNSSGGSASGYTSLRGDADVWMFGTSFELSMFDPFTFALDAYYSQVNFDDVRGAQDTMKGFFVGAAASYKTNYGTPALKAWYASGHDYTDANDDGGLFYLASAFGGTSIMFDNYYVADPYTELANGGSPAGLWGVQLEWADFSFIDKLSHTFLITYMEGTNKFAKGATTTLSNLGEDDSVIEINFNSSYQIYKNFASHLQLGYLITDFDRKFSNDDSDDNIFRGALSFVYNF